MLNIRHDQSEVFSEVALEDFYKNMEVHLEKFFPEQCAEMESGDLRDFIRDGIRLAGKYDIVSERDVSKFLDLMMSFGEEFDELPWAQEILLDPTHNHAGFKTDTLFEAGVRLIS